MGWTFTNRPKGQSLKSFFNQEFNHPNGKVIDCAVKNNVAFIAYEFYPFVKTNPLTGKMIHIGSKEITGIVCPLSYRRNDYYNQGYKDMDISMGPCYYDCPERILKLITYAKGDYATEWMKKAWECVNKNKSIPKLKIGMIISFDTAITFLNGITAQTFCVDSLKPLRFRQYIDNRTFGKFIIPRWYIKKNSFKIIDVK